MVMNRNTVAREFSYVEGRVVVYVDAETNMKAELS